MGGDGRGEPSRGTTWDGRASEHRGGGPDAFQGAVLLPLPEIQQLPVMNREKKKKRKNMKKPLSDQNCVFFFSKMTTLC